MYEKQNHEEAQRIRVELASRRIARERMLAELSEWHGQPFVTDPTRTGYCELIALSELHGAPADLIARAARLS